ncbi:putative Ig domain-containing protein [Stenotrophomonas sp. CFBP8994]|uniref:putative Ig domain-containing protein n=1 Tax=Stenotrophomonas sp. CFBP8994 TaxID=3096527 RepID=UPI002A69E01E|nr:putative Ig domain-containing protein [Stenotrophomonas sp. CFBP8994]MDY0981699.1 putative Ig domain-containing protein [Stenotrophomonas sp. CFBP8994]
MSIPVRHVRGSMVALLFLTCMLWLPTAYAQTPALTVPNVTVQEGNSTGVANVQVVLDIPAPSDVTFEYFTVDAGAVAGTDYTGIPSTVGTIPAGGQQLTIPVTILGNTLAESDKSFAMQLINIAGASPGSIFGTVTLLNDDAALTLSPAAGALPAAAYATPYSATFTGGGGTGSFSYASTGTLPPGLTLSPAGVLSGTPSAPGSYAFDVTATDVNSAGPGAPYTVVQSYTLQVTAAAIAVTPATLPNGTAGVAYSQTGSATGGVAPYTFTVTAGTLPAGLSLAPGGALTGAPSSVGTFSFTVTATDTNGQTGSAAYSITITAPTIVLAPAAGPLPQATYAAPYSQSFTANGGVGPYSYVISSGALPAGLALDSSGALSGTPTAPGTYNFAVDVTDTGLAGPGAPYGTSAAYVLTVSTPTITVSPSTLPTPVVGVAYSQTVTANGGVPGYTFSVSGGTLPPGLSLSPGGTLSGTPLAAGGYSFSIQAIDSNGQSGAQLYGFTINAPAIDIQPAAVPAGTVGAAYSETLSASGGTAPYTFSLVSGALPPGMTLSGAGALEGTPTSAGTFTFTARVTDSSSGGPYTADRSYSLVIGSPTINVDPTVAPAGAVGVAYALQLSASGGTAPYQFTVAGGALPQGVGLAANGSLSGTPVQAGTFNVTVAATDANAQVGTGNYTIAVTAPALSLTPGSGAFNATYGVAFAETLAATGGVGPYTYAIAAGQLPAGISLTGDQLSGTPTAPGTYAFTITATDTGSTGAGAPFTASASYSLTVSAPAITITTASLPDGTVGAAYSQQLVAEGGLAPYAYTIATGQLPSGLQLSSSGQLTGTATSSGSYAFTATATDANGQQGTRAYTLQVGDAAPVAAADTATVLAGSALPIAVTANDSGAITAVTVVQPPQHGTVTVTDQVVTYTAASDYEGQDSFQYTASGPGGVSAPAQVTITVNPAPVAVSRTVSAAVAAETRVELTEGARGGPFTGATLVSLAPAAAGVATIVSGPGGTQELRFRASNTFAGEAVATFTLSNAYATSAQASVRFQVQARPDPTLDADVRGLANAQLESARRFAHTQIDNFQSRLERLHGNAPRGRRLDNQLSFATRERCVAGVQGNTAQSCADEALQAAAPWDGDAGRHPPTPGAVGEGATQQLHSGAWISGSLRSGGYRGVASTSSVGFETSGVSAGYDADITQDLSLGAGLGYGRDSSDVGQAGSRAKAEAFSVVGYASYHPGAFFIDGLVGYQTLSYDLRRHLTQTGYFVQGDRDGKQWFGSVSVGADLLAGATQVTPYIRYDLARGNLDPYQEAGSDLWALTYGRTNVASTRGSAGVRLDFRREFDWGAVTPLLRVEYQRELEGNDSATVRYADTATGPFYDLRPVNYDRSRFVLGVGASFNWNSGWSTRVEYRSDASTSNQHENAYLLNLEKEF